MDLGSTQRSQPELHRQLGGRRPRGERAGGALLGPRDGTLQRLKVSLADVALPGATRAVVPLIVGPLGDLAAVFVAP